MKLINFYLLALLVLSSCHSKQSEIDKKYQGCILLKSMTAGDANFEVTLDCEAGRDACVKDISSTECSQFLNSVRTQD